MRNENIIKKRNLKIEKILEELVDIPSYDKIDRNHKIIKYLLEKFSDCNEIVLTESPNGCTNLLIGLNTSLKDLKNCILLSGHVDTVAPENSFKKSKLKNECLFGLGASDMKSFIATVIFNLKNIANRKVPIVLSVTSDEETKFLGIESNINELKKRNINPSLVIVGEPTNLQFSNCNKGATWLTINILGKSCHASTPIYGVNAVERAVKSIYFINKLNKNLKSSSITTTKISGGIKGNIVPSSCSFKLDIRLEKLKDYDKIKSKLLKILTKICIKKEDFSINSSKITYPFEKKRNNLFKIFAKNNNILFTESYFTTEAGAIQKAFDNIQIIVFGPGNIQSIHSENEYIEIKNLINYSNLLMKFISENDTIVNSSKSLNI